MATPNAKAIVKQSTFRHKVGHREGWKNPAVQAQYGTRAKYNEARRATVEEAADERRAEREKDARPILVRNPGAVEKALYDRRNGDTFLIWKAYSTPAAQGPELLQGRYVPPYSEVPQGFVYVHLQCDLDPDSVSRILGVPHQIVLSAQFSAQGVYRLLKAAAQNNANQHRMQGNLAELVRTLETQRESKTMSRFQGWPTSEW